MADLENRSQLEAQFTAKLSKLNARHRRELVALLGSPPDVRRVTQAFWDRVERETEEEAAALLWLIFMASARQHSAPFVPTLQIDPGDLRKQLEDDAAAYARDRLKTLIPGYIEHSKDMLGTAGTDWETQGAAGDVITRKEVDERVGTIFGEGRAEGIGVTETTAAGSAGGESGIGNTVGVSTKDLWIIEDQNACPICKPLNLTPRSNWERFFPQGPPAHPICRCHVRYAAEVPAGKS